MTIRSGALARGMRRTVTQQDRAAKFVARNRLTPAPNPCDDASVNRESNTALSPTQTRRFVK